MDSRLETLIIECLGWDITNTSIEYQTDGLTNQNYIIFKGDLKYAIRISGNNSGELGINRHAELAAMKEAAAIGIGAEIVYFSTETGHMITEYIDGKKWSNDDVATNENITRIADALKKVHNLPPIPFEFSPYKDIEDRIQFAIQNNIALPDYLDSLLNKLYAIKQEREKNESAYLGLCHNDPFHNNFLDDGTVRLIDWEYTGMGDIFFDLSCICMSYTPSNKEQFLRQYFGQCDSNKLESLGQMSFVVDFWNCMWAVLQTVLSDAKHDYKTMAEQAFNRMKNEL